jgi:predicted O-methyltransferase YrrM
MALVSAATGDDRPPWRLLLSELRYSMQLRALPPRVAWFQSRARRVARRSADQFSLSSATRPADLALLLRLARRRRRVVELGTGTAWTTIALALADRQREVTTYDPIARAERERYLGLVAPEVQRRITFVAAPGSTAPDECQPIDLLYIDSSHEREQTTLEFRAWRPALAPGAFVVFDDYIHPDFPGVREAVAELGLDGERHGTLFVHQVAR